MPLKSYKAHPSSLHKIIPPNQAPNCIDAGLAESFQSPLLNQLTIHMQALEDKLNVLTWSFVDKASSDKSSDGRSRELIPKVELWIRRDLIVVALERDWDKIEKRLMKAETDDEYRDILKTILGSRADLNPRLQFSKLGDLFSQYPLQMQPANKILKALGRRDQMAMKLFNRLPSRAIANAIAGAPEYTCWSSFRYSTCHPSPVPICDNLWGGYKRQYKKIVPELKKAK
jgi:hypothetical protein